jgi:class III poly(R)-hydroxyalkanoic acid synthase PhaE subunit
MSKNGTSFSDAPNAMPSFMETMASAQQRWLKSVADNDAMSSVPPVFNEAASQWRSALTDTMDTWSGETEPIMKQTMERMTQGQSLMLQVYQVALEAWQEAAQRVGEGDDMSEVMQAYVERIDDQIRKATTSWSHLAQDQQVMWQKFVESMQGAGLPFGMLLSMPVPSGEGQTAETPMAAMFESLYRMFEFETLAGRLLDAPAIGLSREFTEKVAQTFKSFQEYQRASARYQTVVASIWSDTLQSFATKLGKKMQEGDGVETLRDLSKLWTKVADKTFIRAFRTDDYIEAQNDYLEASLQLRQDQRTLAEEVQRALDQPTRSELDEVYKLLNRLRRENKDLKKQLRNVPTDTNGAAASSAADVEPETEALREEINSLRGQVADLRAAVHATADASPDEDTSPDEDVAEPEAPTEAEPEAPTEAEPEVESELEAAAEPDAEPEPDAAQVESSAEEPPDAPDDLTAIKGIGSATQEQLYAAGLTTYQQLADASGDAICEALGADISADRLNAWRDSARELA